MGDDVVKMVMMVVEVIVTVVLIIVMVMMTIVTVVVMGAVRVVEVNACLLVIPLNPTTLSGRPPVLETRKGQELK